MAKKLYYVPMVLVIKEDDEGTAEGVAEQIVSSVVHLGIPNLEGFTLVSGFATSEASKNWFENEQHLEPDGEFQVHVVERK